MLLSASLWLGICSACTACRSTSSRLAGDDAVRPTAEPETAAARVESGARASTDTGDAQPAYDCHPEPMSAVAWGAPQPDSIEFAVADKRGVRLYDVGPDEVDLRQSVDVPGCPISIARLDSKRLAILAEAKPSNTDQYAARLFVYDEGELQEQSLPNAEAWKGEGSATDAVRADYHQGGELLATPEGELWMARCAWRYRVDANSCKSRSFVRILPSVTDRRLASPVKAPPGIHQRALAAPPNVQIQVIGEQYQSQMVCRADRAVESIWPPDGGTIGYPGQDGSESVVWLSQDPPVYAAVVPDVSGELPDAYYLFTACENEPHFDAATHRLVFGPPGIWAAYGRESAEERWYLYFGGRRVGWVDMVVD